MNLIEQFIHPDQLRVIKTNCRGEEGQWFKGKLLELTTLILSMPKTYEQEGKGDQAMAYLHYFIGGCDWWIKERDMESEQHQAFGLADLGYGPELGYISIVELLANGVELDLHFTPMTLADLKLINA